MDISEQISNAARVIKSGGVVAFPTETVYGLGANALNPNAVAKIFEIKERPSFDPLIVHIASKNDLFKLATNVDDRVLTLADKFWPGPLTIVLSKKEIISDIVTSGLPTVGIRMPSHPIALELIEKSTCPIAAPSANKFGRISPTKAIHVKNQLPELEYIIDGGQTKVGIESTVITLDEEGFIILRAGVITEDEIKEIVPISSIKLKHNLNFSSPGLMKSHYSPEKPLYLINEVPFNINREKTAYIAFSEPPSIKYKIVEILSKSADLSEAAVNLFDILHRLEQADVDCIIAETVPANGIGIAIMDRLKKAAYRYKNY